MSERLPNEYEFIKSYRRNKYVAEFIVMIKGANRPTTLYFTHNGWWTDNMKDRYDVTAWMPLPEPYLESEKRMANRNTLHSNKLDAFRKWLIKTGWTIEEPKGIWEVLRAKKAGRKNPLIVYQKMNKEHLSVLDRDIDVIKRFLQEK